MFKGRIGLKIRRQACWFASLFVFFICACGKNTADREIVAKAYNYVLYKSDLKGIVPVGTSASDSLEIIKNFVDSWIRKHVLLKKAEDNLSGEQKDFEKQLEDYRNSLITYAYEKELVSQKLDTVVSDKEIEEYYNSHQDNFQLKDNIIKVWYLKIKKGTQGLEKVKQWYRSNDENSRQSLEEFCHKYAENFFLDDQTWLLFDDLLKEIPIKTYDKEQYLKNNRFVEVADSANLYLVNIKGFKIRESISPLSFERENIRAIILNSRKLSLIGDMEKKIYNEAVNNKDFEIFQ